MIRSRERLTIVAMNDGLQLTVRGLGRHEAPATIVYLHGAFTDSCCWNAVRWRLHEQLDGGIWQLAYDQRGFGSSGRSSRGHSITLAQLADDLDAVLTRATGAVVLVTHSVGSLVALAYAHKHPHRAAALSGIVMLNGAMGLPCLPTGVVAPAHIPRCSAMVPQLQTPPWARAHGLHVDPNMLGPLRTVPSFVLAGANDPILAPRRSAQLAEAIWGDYEIIPGAGHFLPQTEPGAVVGAILRALQIAYRSDTNPWLAHGDRETHRRGGDRA